MSEGALYVLAAGGTGGHVFPAEALAERLARQGGQICLVTDRRADVFAAAPAGAALHRICAGRVGGGPLNSAYGVAETAVGLVQALRLLRRLGPAAVVGFGGYPSLPTMLAATQLGLPTVIHEQNAVLGRANRLLARRVGRIATGFAETAGLRPTDRTSAVHTGNPVRSAIGGVAGSEYRVAENGEALRLVILGGSQGARIFADLVPPALALLPASLRERLRVSQQVRPEDLERVSGRLEEAGIAARVQEFFTDVPERLTRAQLVISRAGASTVAELAVVGRPALLVPYPYATDDHQTANARAFAAAGGGWMLPQDGLDAPALARVLVERLTDAAGLAAAAAAARRFAIDDAADRLASVVLDLGAAAARSEERAA